jgi:hypothetical protein
VRVKRFFHCPVALALSLHTAVFAEDLLSRLTSSGAEASDATVPYWKSLPDPGTFIGLSYLWQNADDPLRGFKLSSGLVNESDLKHGTVRRNEMDSWLSRRASEDQVIWSVGLAADVPYALAFGPVRTLARGLVGLEYRTEGSDDGLGVVGGLGLSLEVWVSRHVSISLDAERRWSYPGSDNTQLGIALRFVDEKMPALIPLA